MSAPARGLVGVVVAAVVSILLLAQRPVATPSVQVLPGDEAATMGVPAQPKAISGSPSSARYCVSGFAANVHSLGWIDAGATLTVTFDSDIPIVAAVNQLDLEGGKAYHGFGAPDLSFVNSSGGTVAVLVSGKGRAACYRFKARIDPPAKNVIAARAAVSNPLIVTKPPKSPIQMMAVSGLATSAKHCVSGKWVTKAHPIGRVEQGTPVAITFDSDFDPMAGAAIVDLSGQRSWYYYDDDSGGNQQPSLNFNAEYAGTVVLYVGGYDGSAGCYHYKVEVTSTTPSPTPTPTPGPVPAPTIQTVAPVLGETTTRVILTALSNGASTRSARRMASPASVFGRLFTMLEPPAFAQPRQTPRWSADCPAGGNARIDLPDNLPFIGEVTLTNTSTVWTSCSMRVGSNTATVNGQTRLNGRWTQANSNATIQQQGSLDVSPIGSVNLNTQITGSTGQYNGQIGDVPVGGIVDGPFIPTPSPAPPPPAPNPPPAPAPTPSPTPIPSPPPGGAGRFDGLYVGQVDSSSFPIVPVGQAISFQLSNGRPAIIAGVTVNFSLCTPGTWSGGVDTNGILQLDGTYASAFATCSLSGLLVLNGSNVMGSGTFSVTWNPPGRGPAQTSGGRWSVTRIGQN